MNSTRDIYQNIFNNIYKYYGPNRSLSTPLNSTLPPDYSSWNKFCSAMYEQFINKGTNVGILVAKVPVKREEIEIIPPEEGNEQDSIPVWVWFVADGSKTVASLTNNAQFDPQIVNFVISIVTHKHSSGTIDRLAKNVRCATLFYRQFDYREFSIDIFDHKYQPKFTLVRSPDKIDQFLKKYMINLTSVANIYLSDPVNKRMLGLPSIKNREEGVTKEVPDVYVISQPMSVNYRKVVYTQSNDPFNK